MDNEKKYIPKCRFGQRCRSKNCNLFHPSTTSKILGAVNKKGDLKSAQGTLRSQALNEAANAVPKCADRSTRPDLDEHRRFRKPPRIETKMPHAEARREPDRSQHEACREDQEAKVKQLRVAEDEKYARSLQEEELRDQLFGQIDLQAQFTSYQRIQLELRTLREKEDIQAQGAEYARLNQARHDEFRDPTTERSGAAKVRSGQHETKEVLDNQEETHEEQEHGLDQDLPAESSSLEAEMLEKECPSQDEKHARPLDDSELKANRRSLKKARQRQRNATKSVAPLHAVTRDEDLERVLHNQELKADEAPHYSEVLQSDHSTREKRSKKDRRRTRFEQMGVQRADFWMKGIEREILVTALITRICVAEFTRQHPNINPHDGYSSGEAKLKRGAAVKAAYRDLFQPDIKTTFVIVGYNQSLNGRTGTIRHWVPKKSKFLVGVDPKSKGNVQEIFLEPEKMDFNIPEPKRPKERTAGYSRHVVICVDCHTLPLMECTVTTDMIEGMEKCGFSDQFLMDLMERRDKDDRQRRQVELEQRVEAERALKERKNEEHRRWRQQQSEEKSERNRKREKEKLNGEARREFETSGVFYRDAQFFREPHPGAAFHRSRFTPQPCREAHHECECQECTMERLLRHFFFAVHDDDDHHSHYQTEEEGGITGNILQDAANVLGVAVESSPDQIKTAFRMLALKYHPDKYSQGKHGDDTTMADAEEKFKEAANAYAVLRRCT
jgi:hypothetical protein